jgi:nicotinamidase-related amidase
LKNASSLRKWAKTQGILIVHCLIDLKAQTPLRRKMAIRANTVREKMASPLEAANSGEHPDIAATADEYLFWRPPSHVSALGSYGLENLFKEHGIDSLIISGFSSSGCVINTAKEAADKGWVVSVVEDACGDKDEAVHEVIMRKLLVGQAHIVEREELVTAWCKVRHPGCGCDAA